MSTPPGKPPPLGAELERATRLALASSTAAAPFRSPRVRASEFNQRTDEQYLSLSRADLEGIWQKEARSHAALTPRLLPAGDAGAEAADVELALTAVVSLAQTSSGVVRRVVV